MKKHIFGGVDTSTDPPAFDQVTGCAGCAGAADAARGVTAGAAKGSKGKSETSRRDEVKKMDLKVIGDFK